MILQEKSYIHGTRGKPWTLQAGRLARVRAPCRSGSRGEDRCRGISENQQGRTTTTTTTTCHGLLERVSFWVPFCAWFFSCHLQILEWSCILNSCNYLCVCVVQCCSPVNFANFMMTQEKGDQHSIELEKTACDDRRISLFFFFVSLVRCVASTAGQQLLRHVGQWMGWHVQVVDCAEGADWVGGGKKYSFYIWFLAYRHKVFRS